MGYPVQWNKIPNWGCLPPRKKSLKATAINNTHNCNQTQIDQGKSSPFFIIIILFSCFSKFLLWHTMSFLHFTSHVFFRSIHWTLLLLQLHRFIKLTILLMLNVCRFIIKLLSIYCYCTILKPSKTHSIAISSPLLELS